MINCIKISMFKSNKEFVNRPKEWPSNNLNQVRH